MKKPLLLLFFVAASYGVKAQDQIQNNGPKISLHFGFLFSGAGQGLVKEVDRNGFGEESTASGFFFGPEDNPLREEGSVQIGVTFPVRNKYQVKGLFHFKETDVTGTASFFEPLAIKATVTSLALIAYAPLPSPLFRVGAGPAFHFANTKLMYGDTEQAKKTFSKPGFIAEGGISYPANKRFYADLQAQYIFVGKGKPMGSYTYSGTDYADKPVTRNVNFQETSFNNFIISLGVGFRIRKS